MVIIFLKEWKAVPIGWTKQLRINWNVLKVLSIKENQCIQMERKVFVQFWKGVNYHQQYVEDDMERNGKMFNQNVCLVVSQRNKDFHRPLLTTIQRITLARSHLKEIGWNDWKLRWKIGFGHGHGKTKFSARSTWNTESIKKNLDFSVNRVNMEYWKQREYHGLVERSDCHRR